MNSNQETSQDQATSQEQFPSSPANQRLRDMHARLAEAQRTLDGLMAECKVAQDGVAAVMASIEVTLGDAVTSARTELDALDATSDLAERLMANLRRERPAPTTPTTPPTAKRSALSSPPPLKRHKIVRTAPDFS